MVQSMLNDYKEVRIIVLISLSLVVDGRAQGGWLPMWKNVVETSIMVRRSPTTSAGS